ncbi:MAG: PadR family transcriptional regulator [Anaerolineales bacterium]
MARSHSDLTLENILLGLLQDQPQHGYALYKRVQESPELSRIWQVKRSKLYYLLEKLEEKDLLSSSLKASSSHPDRKIYHLTERGRREFETWMKTPVKSGRHMRIAFLSRLLFALEAGETQALTLIQRQFTRCQAWLDNLETQLSELEDPDFFSCQIFKFRMGQVQAMLNWLEDCKKGFAAEKNK